MVKYVLTGSTGGLGSRVFRHLIRLVHASDIIVSLYNPFVAPHEVKVSGVEVRRGDYSQPSTLDTAFAGGDKLLLVSHPSIDFDLRMRYHKAAIDAAKRAGIGHVYYTSLMFGSDSQALLMQAHLATERYLKESGLTYTIIREGVYSEAWPVYFGGWRPGRDNEVTIPHGDGGIAWVCKDDLGEGTARLFAADTHKNETVLFTGSRSVSLAELGCMISLLLRIDPPLKLNIVSEEDYVGRVPCKGDWLHFWATTYPALVRGELAVVDPLLQEILGRELKPFEETLRETLGLDGGEASFYSVNT